MTPKEAAALLDDAEARRAGLEPLSSLAPISPGYAWQVARERDALRRAAGHRQTGYKLGWTSAAMRQALGIPSPNYGTLWDYMRVDSDLHLGALIHPKAEPEFAFLVDETLEGPRVTPDDVLAAGRWAVALEVVDPRWRRYDFTWEDNTADGSSAGRYVVGDWHPAPADPATWSLSLVADDAKQVGLGSAVMGSPAVAVAFLVHGLYEAGGGLDPGMVVLTGGVTAPVDLHDGMRLRVESPQLGACATTCRKEAVG